MTFTNPIALWLAIAIPAVVFAFFIRRRIRRRVVPSLFLWEEALGKSFAKARSFKLRNLLAALVAALITLALVGATTEPIVGDPSRGALVVVFDNSLSMNALEKNGETRLELARRALERLIANKSEESETLILTCAGGPSVACGFTRDAAALRKTVEGIEGTEEACAMSDALALARVFRETRGAGSRVLVLSDGCFQGADEFSKALAEDRDLRFERVGEALDNVAIESFEARRSPIGDAAYEATLTVVNEGEKAASFDVEIGLNDVLVDLVPLRLEPKERAERTLKYESSEGGTLTAQIVIEDESANRLTQDDLRMVQLDGFPTLDVMVYGQYDRFMQTVFESQPNVTVRAIADMPEKVDDSSLLVVCGDVPETLPSGKVALINPTSGADLFEVGEETFDSVVEPGVVESPLTCFMHMDGAPLQNVREIYPYDDATVDVYARTPEAPAIFAARSAADPNSPRWVLNFSCSSASLVLRTTFPILFANLIGAARGDDESSYAPSVPIAAEEFNLRGAVAESGDGSVGGSAPVGRFALWKALAALGAILATLEYYWYCRRRV